MDKKIGNNLKMARKSKGLTQARLAELVGLHEKHISKIENSKSLPSLANLEKILHHLGLELKDVDNINNFVVEQNPLRTQACKIINNASDAEVEVYFGILKQMQRFLEKIQR